MAKKEDKMQQSQMAALMVSQGVAAILFGIVALFWPGLSVTLLVLLYGLFLLVWSVTGLIVGLTSMGKEKFWWLEVLFSLLAVGVAVYLLRNPLIGVALFILLAGLSFAVRGIFDVVEGLFDKDLSSNMRWLRVISGALGVVAGVIVLSQPVSAGVAIVWIMGLYAVLYGVMMITIVLTSQNED